MGILAANMPGFALPEAAYFSPLAWGGSTGLDRLAWFVTYVFVEGKMRGLFSLLFGASMLLVIQRAEQAGESAVQVHFSRMGWLYLIGLAHLYLLWWGDILAHYALVGCAAYPFRRARIRTLLALSALLFAIQFALETSIWLSATSATEAVLASYRQSFGVPPGAALVAEVAAHRGSYAQSFAFRIDHMSGPIASLPIVGSETLGYMLLGMASLRSGFATGRWNPLTYRRIAMILLGLTLPVLVGIAANTAERHFDMNTVLFASLVAGTAIRPFVVIGYAALVIVLMRPGGRLTAHVAAAGRVAFSNYLGTTILVTALVEGYGLGWFGYLSRAQLYPVALAIWFVMLVWSKPWLDRFRYGPLEWVWRSLARLSPQPMVRR